MSTDLKTPVEAWLPFIRTLLDGGASVPLVVLAFMHYRIDDVAYGDAASTVAKATGRTRDDVLAEVCLACTTPDRAAALSRELVEIAPQLDAIEGLERGEGMIPSPEALELFWRRGAIHNHWPMFRPSPHEGWARVLALLRDEGADHAVLSRVVRRYEVTTARDGVLRPLRPSQAEATVDAVGSRASNTQHDAEQLLQRIPGVSRFALQAAEQVPGEIFVPAKGTNTLQPPWTVFPEAPSSLRWRMGGGEDLMHQWVQFMAQLGPVGRREYFEAHSPPDAWAKWVDGNAAWLWP